MQKEPYGKESEEVKKTKKWEHSAKSLLGIKNDDFVTCDGIVKVIEVTCVDIIENPEGIFRFDIENSSELFPSDGAELVFLRAA